MGEVGEGSGLGGRYSSGQFDGRRIPLPSTIGRRNRVLRLARRMREALDLPPR